ncbi:hypothetical protein [Pontibacter roseus]|uniref:hypothetical protein n=1 Tax=Pontibacter roseus TaxID=336989 RepID=UPI000476C81A|nr:hypothetical protein [Pontibacter roseus]
MPYTKLLLLCLLSLAPALLWAQAPKQPVRLELEHEAETSYLEVLPLPDSSLLVYSKKYTSWLTDATFRIEKYDANLERVWSTDLDLKPETEYLRYFSEAPFTYMVFKAPKAEQFLFLRINLSNGKVQLTEHTLEKVEYVYEFNVLHGNYFLITDNDIDQKPALLYLNPNKEKPVILPAVYGSESTFSDLLVDPAYGRADVVLTESNGRIARLQVKSFDSSGKLIRNYFILQQDNRSLLNAEVTPGDTLNKLLFGTYGSRDLRYVQGFFSAPVASQVVDGQFYSFLQLQNFFKYMKPRREARARNRENARVAEGKEPTQRYRMLLHDLITTPTGYVLAAEVYFPQYRSGSSYLDPRIRSANRPATAYKRTHVLALGFDRDGILLWDNIFKLKDLATEELVHAVEVSNLPDGRVVVAYSEEGTIHYRAMEQDRFNDEETTVELLPYEEGEKITFTEYDSIVKWYGEHFAAYGFQRIKSAKGSNRTVFYITKVSF